jgi:hypothetical protein
MRRAAMRNSIITLRPRDKMHVAGLRVLVSGTGPIPPQVIYERVEK